MGRPPPNRGSAQGQGADGNGELLTQARVESEIMRLSGAMDKTTTDLTTFAQSQANAEHAYKVKYAQTWAATKIQPGNGPGGRTTDGEADAAATVACSDQLKQRLLTTAVYEATKEVLRTQRSQIDALRTIAANIRAQT